MRNPYTTVGIVTLFCASAFLSSCSSAPSAAPAPTVSSSSSSASVQSSSESPVTIWENTSSLSFEGGSVSFSLKGIDASAVKNTIPFMRTANELQANAKDCGVVHSSAYYQTLVDSFSREHQTVYTILSNKPTEDVGAFVLTVLPNVPHYKTLAEFKKDFDLCAAAGTSYPLQMNDQWLVFESSCGSGAGSAVEAACDELKKAVESSLKFQ